LRVGKIYNLFLCFRNRIIRLMSGKYNSAFILVTLWFGVIINNFIWIRRSADYLTYDSHRHFLASLRIYEILNNMSLNAVPISIDTMQLHPSLAMAFTAILYFLVGISQSSAVIINGAFFSGILIFSTYKIGFEISNKKTGILAAFIIIMYPVVFNQLKVYMLDMPLTAMVTLTIYFLFRCESFRSMKYSVLFGISFGLGMMTKDSFFIFLLGPLSYVLIEKILLQSPRKECHSFKKRVFYIILSLTFIALISGFYYLRNSSTVFEKAYSWHVTTWPVTVAESGMFIYYLRAMLWYLWGLINWQITFFFFLAFIIGAVLFACSKFKDKDIFITWILVSWMLVAYFRAALEFNMEVTGVRYTMPILPAIALITAFGIMRIPYKKIRFCCVCAIIIFGILQLFLISYPVGSGALQKSLAVHIKLPESIEKYKLFPEMVYFFNFKNWSVSGSASGSHPENHSSYILANEKILSTIYSSSESAKDVTIFIIPDDVRTWYLQYRAYLDKKPYRILCDWNYLRSDMARKGITITDLILNADYIIDKDSGFSGEPYMRDFVTQARDKFSLYKHKFFFLGQEEWPEGSNILIYKKTGAKGEIANISD
jgi:4-amino-4-deoxy-L-arabinose transferase-like glycosyltransferase